MFLILLMNKYRYYRLVIWYFSFLVVIQTRFFLFVDFQNIMNFILHRVCFLNNIVRPNGKVVIKGRLKIIHFSLAL